MTGHRIGLPQPQVEPIWKKGLPPKKPRRSWLRPSPRKNPAKLARARQAVIERSGGMCEADIPEVCAGRGVQAHHVRRRSQGGADTPGNLLWLCTPCHQFVHANPAIAVEWGLLENRSIPRSSAVRKVERA